MPTAQNILTLAGSDAFDSTGDAPLEDRLTTTLGHTLDSRDADGSPAGSSTTSAADVATWDDGDDMIVITSSIKIGSISADIFATSTLPVMHSEGARWEEHNLAKAGSSGETSDTYTQITILDSTHPCAGGKSGDVTILDTAYKLNYCHVDALPDGAIAIASAKGDANLIVLYVIESGDDLADGTAAPDRRVCWFATYSCPTVMTSDAFDIFDACVDWCGNPDSTLTPSGTSTGKSNDSGQAYAIPADPDLATIDVEIAWGVDWKDNPAALDWSSVYSDVRLKDKVRWSRGRTNDLGVVLPGTASFVLNNRNRQYEPGYASGANYPDVRPRAHVRITATWGGVTETQFRGYVKRWRPVYPGDGDDAICKVECVDGLGLAGRITIDGGYLSDLLLDAASPAVHYPLDETVDGSNFREVLRDGPAITGDSIHDYASSTFATGGASARQYMKFGSAASELIPTDVNVETAGVLTVAFWMRDDVLNPIDSPLTIDCRLSNDSEQSFLIEVGGAGDLPTAVWGSATKTENGLTCQPTNPTHASGDRLIAVFGWDASGSANETGPSGWTQIGTTLDTDDGASSAKMAVYSKIATSASETDPTLTVDNNEAIIGYVIAVTGGDNTQIHAQVFDATITDENSPAITTTVDNCLIIRALAADGADAPFSWASSTEKIDEETSSGGNISVSAAEGSQVTAGENAAEAVTYNSTPPTESCFVVLAIAPAGGGSGIAYDHHSDGTGTKATVASSSDAVDGEWHYATLTRSSDANSVKAYIDGVELGDVNHGESSTPSIDTDCALGIGLNFQGWLGELSIVHEEFTDEDVLELYNAWRNVLPRNSTGGRIAQLLRYMRLPSDLCSSSTLDAGSSTMPEEDYTGTKLREAFNDTAKAELGTFFFDRSGCATMHSRTRRKSTNVTTNIGAGTDIEISDPQLASADDYLANIVNVDIDGGTGASAIDNDSVDQLGEIYETIGPLKVTSTTLAGSYADHILTARGDPSLRIDKLTIRPRLNPDPAMPFVLGVEISDRINVAIDPISDSPTTDISFDGFVEHVSNVVTPFTWDCELRLSPAALTQDISF